MNKTGRSVNLTDLPVLFRVFRIMLFDPQNFRYDQQDHPCTEPEGPQKEFTHERDGKSAAEEKTCQADSKGAKSCPSDNCAVQRISPLSPFNFFNIVLQEVSSRRIRSFSNLTSCMSPSFTLR